MLSPAAKRLGHGAKIEPLQVRFPEVINGMIKIEAVNVAADASHDGGVWIRKKPSLGPGLSARTYLTGGCRLHSLALVGRQGGKVGQAGKIGRPAAILPQTLDNYQPVNSAHAQDLSTGG
jgi:hypothetical protein